jgi:hypothetical protein
MVIGPRAARVLDMPFYFPQFTLQTRAIGEIKRLFVDVTSKLVLDFILVEMDWLPISELLDAKDNSEYYANDSCRAKKDASKEESQDFANDTDIHVELNP